MHEAVAIIGIGARFPGAADALAFRRMVREGAVHTRPVPGQRWDHSLVHSPNRRLTNRTPAQAGAFMDDIDRFAPEFFGVSPKRAKVMDPQQRLMLEISRQALEDAGYASRRLAEGRVGVYVGASTSDHGRIMAGAVNIPLDAQGRSGEAPRLMAEEVAALTAALAPIQAYSIVGQQLNMIAANVSQAFDFKGPAFALDTACSSALAALHEAVLHLRAGSVDAAVVGGVYVQLDPIMMVCFSRIGALSFTDSCRPFQAGADGFVIGEGVGAVVLKRLSAAQRDGDRIVAVIRGIAMNNDGGGAGPLTPQAEGQSAVIAQAWQTAGIDPGSVGLLEAHATATLAGDRIELEALTKVFAPHVSGPVPITSIKANIGHGLASSGMASLLKAVLAVRDGFIPPQPLAGELRPEFAGPAQWLRVPVQREPWTSPAGTPRRAGVSAFGFGGTNVHVVLEQAPEVAGCRPAAPAGGWRCELSAPSSDLLAAYCGELEEALRQTPARIEDVAFTLAQRRRDPVCAAVLAASAEELAARLAAVRGQLARGEVPPVPAAGATTGGRLITLPPSPLATRRFWLIDEDKIRRSALAIPRPPPPPPPTTGQRSLDLLIAAIVEVTARSVAEVRAEQKFVGDLAFDSLTTLELITVLGHKLPGLTPPRSLFTPTLTVQELADFLEQAAPPEVAPAVRCTLAVSAQAWLHQHRPGGRALLPLAALVTVALADRPMPVRLVRGKVLAPCEVQADALVLERVDEAAGGFVVQAAGTVLASGAVETAVGPLAAWPAEPLVRGGLSLPHFYEEFGFHGPALRALAEIPAVGAMQVSGRLTGHPDPVVLIDGMLQLALYWLAVNRGVSAVATGFAEFRQLAPWPRAGDLACTGRLTGATPDRLLGDFDLRDAQGVLVVQWRGVEAQVIGAVAEPKPAVAAWPEVQALAARKASLAASGFTMPYFHAHEGVAGAITRIGGREFVNFSSYNYLGLAGDPAVNRASADAVQRYGTSASASRVASGERPLHGELERAVAGFLGCDDALTLVSGHATNVTLISHLFGPEDIVIHDSLAHDCIVSGARLSGARRLVFPHNDVAALARLLEVERPKARRALVAVEGVYSMDGDLAPLDEVIALKQRHDALLLVDEAHSLGVLGATGRGIGEHFGVPRAAVDLWMGTLSKALASCGGYVAGEAALIDYLRYTLPGFVYSVGLPPANAAAALAALRLLGQRPELPRRLQARSEFFRDLCRERGLDTGLSRHSAVVPFLTGSSELALHMSQALGERGINVQPIFHPAVEEGKARLRFFMTAGHTEAQLRETADALAEIRAQWREARA